MTKPDQVHHQILDSYPELTIKHQYLLNLHHGKMIQNSDSILLKFGNDPDSRFNCSRSGLSNIKNDGFQTMNPEPANLNSYKIFK